MSKPNASGAVDDAAVRDVADLLGMTVDEVREAVADLPDDGDVAERVLVRQAPPVRRPHRERPRAHAPAPPVPDDEPGRKCGVMQLLAQFRADGVSTLTRPTLEDSARARTMELPGLQAPEDVGQGRRVPRPGRSPRGGVLP